MGTDINRVRYVEEIDSSKSGLDINTYLAIDGWILLNTETKAATGDSGPYSWTVYIVGWTGLGDPEVPITVTRREPEPIRREPEPL